MLDRPVVLIESRNSDSISDRLITLLLPVIVEDFRSLLVNAQLIVLTDSDWLGSSLDSQAIDPQTQFSSVHPSHPHSVVPDRASQNI